MWPLVLLVLAQARFQSHLGQELSPYLLQHAADDVEWFPWGTEALARARREGKPLFVVLGDSANHSCRVADRELLGDVAVARSLNGRFLSVRVDRDERPDIDRSLRWLTGATEYPILVAITPEGVPVPDGTYDLHEQGYDPRAFCAWLTTASASFRALPAGSTTKTKTATPTGGLAAPFALELADEAVRKTVTGLGGGIRPGDVRALPHGALRLLLTDRARAQNRDALRMATTLLDRMARGGIRDQVAGGFHHAAAGGSWTVAHFEKLLCDNALLLRAYAQAYAAAKDLLYRDVAREISTWAIREMRDSSGLFWTSLSATTEGQEGRFYLWTRDELVGALGADRAAEFLQDYRLEPPGVLSLVGSPFSGLGPSREILQARRARRVRPTVDDRVLAGWNGLMIGALATSGSLLKRGPDIEAARRAAIALRDRLGPANRLRHFAVGRETRGSAFLQDYAYLAEGLLDLYEATGEQRWRDDAGSLVDAAVPRFWDVAQGGFREADETHAPSLPSPKTALDGDLPSANGVMASVLLRFWRLTGERRYLELGHRTIDAFRAELEESPQATCALAAAATLLPPAPRTSR